MERFVVSRELAEKLKAAGYPQGTLYEWASPSMAARERGRTEAFIAPRDRIELASIRHSSSFIAAAPLSDELLEQIPKEVAKKELVVSFSDLDTKTYAGYAERDIYGYYTLDDSYFGECFGNDKPADSLAELWLWARENGHV